MTPEELRERRTRLGLNQDEFGALFNPPVPQNTISRWELGRHAIDPIRSIWLDQELTRIERTYKRPRGRPSKRRRRPPSGGPGSGAGEGEG